MLKMKKQQVNRKASDLISTPTNNNYYTKENDWNWQSKSVFWQFLQCESGALAQMKGEYDPFKDKTPLLFGNFLHSYFESPEAFTNFIKQNKGDLFKYGNPKKGLKKVFEHAQECINTLLNDEYFSSIYQGEKEVIVKGKLFGVNWKGKIDCLDLENKVFYDLKTVDDINKKHWIDGHPTNFAVARGYDMQMAVYQELIKQTFGVECKPYIIAVSKQEVPDKGIFQIPQLMMDDRMDEIEAKQPHIQKVINGEEKPKECGHCDWCRSKKQLDILNVPSIMDIRFD